MRVVVTLASVWCAGVANHEMCKTWYRTVSKYQITWWYQSKWLGLRDNITGGWRKFHNEVLSNLSFTRRIVEVIKSRKICKRYWRSQKWGNILNLRISRAETTWETQRYVGRRC